MGVVLPKASPPYPNVSFAVLATCLKLNPKMKFIGATLELLLGFFILFR